eukprot:1189955-Prorocentrum_minimum.AAC.1
MPVWSLQSPSRVQRCTNAWELGRTPESDKGELGLSGSLHTCMPTTLDSLLRRRAGRWTVSIVIPLGDGSKRQRSQRKRFRQLRGFGQLSV